MSTPATHRRQLPFWQLNALMWAVFAVLFFVRTQLHLDFWPSFFISTFQLAVCLIFTALLAAIYRRLEEQADFGVRTAAWIIVLSLLATIVQSSISHIVVSYLNWYDKAWSLLDLWLLRVMFFWLVYMAWSLLFFWLRAERSAEEQSRRALEARAEAQRIELHYLRSQLDPHFLFNALNGIATVTQKESPGAAAMVRELADYLRYSLERRHDTTVPLVKEIDAMMAYLRVEQARFDGELHVEITTDDDARAREVPCFILLPLVENAVKHSFQLCEPPWHIVITAETVDGSLHITVCNPGSLAQERQTASGVGLEILQRRLELHYPQRHQFSLSEKDGMVCASLTLEGAPCSA